MAQQRMHQHASSGGPGSLGLIDGAGRMQSHGAASSENQVHQVPQPGGGVAPQDGGNLSVQESERSGPGENRGPTSNEHLQQGPAAINDGSQNALRRTGALSLMASAASAFDAAKDIMEALRSKHTNLASELEVEICPLICFRYENLAFFARTGAYPHLLLLFYLDVILKSLMCCAVWR